MGTGHKASRDELEEAIFGIAKVDLLDPVRPIVQGTFNARPLTASTVGRLIQDMKIQGVRRHQYATAIPLLAKKRHIHSTAIFKDVTRIGDAPKLKLSVEGEEVVKQFFAAGGNHRTAAVKALAEEEAKKIGQLEKMIEEGGEEKKKSGRMSKLTEELEESRKTLASMGLWTVILYDGGENDFYFYFYLLSMLLLLLLVRYFTSGGELSWAGVVAQRNGCSAGGG